MIEVLRCTVNNKPVEVGIDPRESLADVFLYFFIFYFPTVLLYSLAI